MCNVNHIENENSTIFHKSLWVKINPEISLFFWIVEWGKERVCLILLMLAAEARGVKTTDNCVSYSQNWSIPQIERKTQFQSVNRKVNFKKQKNKACNFYGSTNVSLYNSFSSKSRRKQKPAYLLRWWAWRLLTCPRCCTRFGQTPGKCNQQNLWASDFLASALWSHPEKEKKTQAAMKEWPKKALMHLGYKTSHCMRWSDNTLTKTQTALQT